MLLVVIAVTAVVVFSLTAGRLLPRFVGTTSDFSRAARGLKARTNALATTGELASVALVLGSAGAVARVGVGGLWYPLAFAAGFLAYLQWVAAPLRRSAAYTVPDFVQLRLDSLPARRASTIAVVLISWFYLIPQLTGAGLVLQATIGWPLRLGALLVAGTVLLMVMIKALRPVTLVGAVHLWIKLLALALPLAWLATSAASGDLGSRLAGQPAAWSDPLQGAGPGGVLPVWSLLLAGVVGTLGLPQVISRFHACPDADGARRTAVVTLVLLGIVGLCAVALGVLVGVYLPGLDGAASDAGMLLLPQTLAGPAASLLQALLAAGAFSAAVVAAAGAVSAVIGALSGDVQPDRGPAEFSGVLLALPVPLVIAVIAPPLALAPALMLALSVAASTLGPLILLGIWWRGLTDVGAVAGLLVGALGAGVPAALVQFGVLGPDSPAARPALVTAPAAALVMWVISRITAHRRSRAGIGVMVRMHVPERLLEGTGTDGTGVHVAGS